jgi:putative transposase
MSEADFADLAAVIDLARESLKFLLTAWVFLHDHWHAVIFPPSPLSISRVMKVIKSRSTFDLREGRENATAIWQARFYDHALRTVQEYHDCLRYLHYNPVQRGLVSRAEEWKWSSIHSYGGPQKPVLPVDRVRLPADGRARI